MKSNEQHPNGNQDWRTSTAAFAERVERAGKRAVAAAIAEHHRAGDPVAIWQDGGIVWLYPDGSTRPHVPGEEPPR
jgi:hypothetical protein